MTLYKRGTVYWSYVWVDGVRYAKSTETANRRLAEQIDQRHREELRLKELCPDLNPDTPLLRNSPPGSLKRAARRNGTGTGSRFCCRISPRCAFHESRRARSGNTALNGTGRKPLRKPQ